MWSSERLLKLVATVLAVALLAGCGFQVRGAAQLPPSVGVVYIDTSDRYTVFYRQLTAAIRQDNRRITRDSTAADAVIRILRDETGQRVLSVSARNVPREYDVYYTIRYSVLVNGNEVLPPEQLTLTRDHTYDETQVLGKALEEETLRESLAADLVGLVTRRVSSLL
jgi:LPS-assembly lipoprotein